MKKITAQEAAEMAKHPSADSIYNNITIAAMDGGSEVKIFDRKLAPVVVSELTEAGFSVRGPIRDAYGRQNYYLISWGEPKKTIDNYDINNKRE